MSEPKSSDDSAVPEFWPTEVRRQRERRNREAILALPQWTLFRAGWLTPSGRVQGATFYRLADGCGPTGRDLDARQVLDRAAAETPYMSQPWTIEVLAEALPEPRLFGRSQGGDS